MSDELPGKPKTPARATPGADGQKPLASNPNLSNPRISNPNRPKSPNPLVSNPNLSSPTTSNPNLLLVSNPGISAPGMKGLRGTIARLLATAANGLLKLTRLGISQAKSQGGKALTQFSQRPEHTRQRVYAFGGYSLICALTLVAQLWEPNSLRAYVRVEPVALPEATIIFVRNDSAKVWKNVRLTLNGRYGYQGADMKPNDYISHRVDRFAAYDQNGKADFAPKETVPHQIAIDCDRGHFELDLDQR